MKYFEDRAAVITGAASGIGEALAHAFAERGMKLFLADIDGDALDSVAEALAAKGVDVATETVDVGNSANVERLCDAAYERFGEVAILCNNAGVIGPYAETRELRLEDWQWVLNVNLYGVIHGMHYFLPRMLESQTPCHIVNIASIASLMTAPRLGPYYASKSAVLALSECASYECEETNVDISVVTPGAVKTRIANTHRYPQAKGGDSILSEGSREATEEFARVIDAGIPPEELAKKVIAAIEERKLFVITHPEHNADIASRCERILAARP
jgi:short-subunit dehydrogenase